MISALCNTPGTLAILFFLCIWYVIHNSQLLKSRCVEYPIKTQNICFSGKVYVIYAMQGNLWPTNKCTYFVGNQILILLLRHLDRMMAGTLDLLHPSVIKQNLIVNTFLQILEPLFLMQTDDLLCSSLQNMNDLTLENLPLSSHMLKWEHFIFFTHSSWFVNWVQ